MSEFADFIVNHSMDRLLFVTAIFAGFVYFIPVLWGRLRVIRSHLGDQLSTDPPEFEPKSSSATSLTAVTGVFGAILSAKVLPIPSPASPGVTTTHLPSAEAYVYLNVLFIALLGLGLVFYFRLGRSLGVYLIADWLIFWGLSGAVFSFDLALLELTNFSPGSRALFGIIVSGALIAVVISRIRDATALLKDLSASRSHAEVAKLMGAKRWKVK